MKKIIFIWILVTVSAYVSSALAGNVTLPNTFVPGEIATAAGVNENFTTVEGGVNGNAASIPILKDLDGQAIGTVIEIISTEPMIGAIGYQVFNSSKYTFKVHLKDGTILYDPIVYSSPDCTPVGGILYYTYNHPQSVFTVNGELYYVPEGSTTTTITVYSRLNDSGECEPVVPGAPAYVRVAQPNDSSVTGVSASYFEMPLSLGTN